MQYKTFSAFGTLPLPVIGMGCWALGGTFSGFNPDDAKETIKQALESGINFFDTAPIYGKGVGEERLGDFLFPYKREDLFIATKCGFVWDYKGRVKQNITAVSLKEQVRQSLSRLKTSYIDLYQIHCPYHNMPLEEALGELLYMQKEGLIRFIGLSNFSLTDMKLANSIATIASYQGLYNLLERNASQFHRHPLPYRTEEEILPYLQTTKACFLAYSPLMQGLLTGKFSPTEQDNFTLKDERMSNDNLRGEGLKANLTKLEQLKALCQEWGITVHQVAIHFLIRQKIMGPVLCGMHKPHHLTENIKATQINLTDHQIAKLHFLTE